MTIQPVRNSNDDGQNSLSSGLLNHQVEQYATGILSQSLPGQYLAMFLFIQAGFAALVWGWFSPDALTRFITISSALWVMARVLGIGSTWLLSSIITLILTGIILLAGRPEGNVLPDWLVSGPFSSHVIIIMLGVVFFLDLRDLVETHGQNFADIFRQHGLIILKYGIIIAILIYVIVVPIIREMIFIQNPPDKPVHAMERLTLTQNMLFNFVESITGLLFLTLGTVIGSFMNAVIYRVPLGISVISQRSHCPSCGTTILATDNLPLIGWLRLNGQCRNCQEKISARYPVVEGFIGLTFLLLFFVELISGGTNLPIRSPNTYTGVQWILFYTKWDLVGLYLYHCLLICTLFSWAMIRRDGYQIPLKTSVLMMKIIIVLPLLFPHLLPWPYNLFEKSFTLNYSVQTAALSSLLGLFAGGIISMLPMIFRGGQQEPRQPSPIFDRPSWLMIGAGLGWQAVAGVFTFLIIWMIGCGLLLPKDQTAKEEPPDQFFSSHQKLPGSELRLLALPCVVIIHQCLWREISLLFASI